MELNKETSTTLLFNQNQTNPNPNPNSNPNPNPNSNSNPNPNPYSNQISISNPYPSEENLQFINYSSFDRFNALSNDIGIEIFKAYWKDTNTYVALKKIQFRYLEDLKSFRNLSYHQNILSIFGYSKDPNNGDYFLVTEFVNGGNLRQYLEDNHRNLSWNDKMRLVIDVTNGLQCMHSHNILHLTLHPKNVFVHNHRLLIGYLGHLKSMDDVSISENIDTDILPYIEPHFISNPSYPRDNKSDIYSLGFLMYEISSGKAPFASIRHSFEISRKLMSGIREKPIVGTPIEYIDLYEQCWDNDPKIRPNVGDALSRLGRMNLSPVHEDIKIMTAKKVKIDNNKNDRPDYGTESENYSVGVTSGTSTQNNDIKIDFGNGTDSGFGGESRSGSRIRPRTDRKCKILPCLPKLRITYGAFLCWICVIMIIACAMLGIFLTGMLKKKKN